MKNLLIILLLSPCIAFTQIMIKTDLIERSDADKNFTNIFDARALPVNFRHKEHWHNPKKSKGPNMLQETFPQRHSPNSFL